MASNRSSPPRTPAQLAAKSPRRAKRGPATANTERKRLTPEDRRRQILDAAVSYFAEVGFDGGTRDLAHRLGVTQPLIYRYFPSKDDLIRQVYEEVYLGRWRAEWEVMITDRSIPLRDRLVAFYRSYGEVIFATEWMRIYLFAGLRGLGINRWWITFVESHVLNRICEEIRVTSKLASPQEIPIQQAELDYLWIFHGGFFYNGMRRHLYGTEPHLDLEQTIELAVDGLLASFPAISRRLIKSMRSDGA